MLHKVLVCGGRKYSDRQHIFDTLDTIHWLIGIYQIIHGAAPGADTLAEAWAESNDVMVKRYVADWNNLKVQPLKLRIGRDGLPYNAAAGGIRNQLMLDDGKPNLVIAFPGGTGTADMVRRARAAGLKPLIIGP